MTSIPEWIVEFPETTIVFTELELDQSCGGKSLEYLAMQKGLSPQHVLQRLRRKIKAVSRNSVTQADDLPSRRPLK